MQKETAETIDFLYDFVSATRLTHCCKNECIHNHPRFSKCQLKSTFINADGACEWYSKDLDYKEP